MNARVPYRPGLIRSTSGSGLVAEFDADLALWRHLYRVLRRAGVPAWKARYDLWTLAFDACTAAEYVSVLQHRTEVGAAAHRTRFLVARQRRIETGVS
ncbi:hypothetical protein [Nannocystis sp.]|uniref:hypothetical protein n=1 Tax=Nannocystis sp. TaxID=1962667 RepID=UPI0025EDFD5E|nr:hypothetical protein [Nannocystis sp.]